MTRGSAGKASTSWSTMLKVVSSTTTYMSCPGISPLRTPRDSLSTTLLVELLQLSSLSLKPLNLLPPEAKLLKVPISLADS